MRDDLPSFTASVVAFARATASVTDASVLDPRDSLSCALLPKPFALATDGLQRLAELSPQAPRWIFAASLGLFDHVVLRTAAIDDALQQAIDKGIDQLVILGAGLDARAHRMQSLRDATVYEVDHPASQRFKRRKAQRLPVMAKDLRYVAVDFERERLDERLLQSGFDSSRRSFWIWEGVIPYLHLSAIEGTLRAIHTLSARGSELVATYVTNQSQWVRRRRMITQSALRFIGEPLRTQMEPQEAATLAFDAGFEVLGDSQTRDWQAKYARAQRRKVPPLEHIIHVRR